MQAKVYQNMTLSAFDTALPIHDAQHWQQVSVLLVHVTLEICTSQPKFSFFKRNVMLLLIASTNRHPTCIIAFSDLHKLANVELHCQCVLCTMYMYIKLPVFFQAMYFQVLPQFAISCSLLLLYIRVRNYTLRVCCRSVNHNAKCVVFQYSFVACTMVSLSLHVTCSTDVEMWIPCITSSAEIFFMVERAPGEFLAFSLIPGIERATYRWL